MLWSLLVLSRHSGRTNSTQTKLMHSNNMNVTTSARSTTQSSTCLLGTHIHHSLVDNVKKKIKTLNSKPRRSSHHRAYPRRVNCSKNLAISEHIPGTKRP